MSSNLRLRGGADDVDMFDLTAETDASSDRDEPDPPFFPTAKDFEVRSTDDCTCTDEDDEDTDDLRFEDVDTCELMLEIFLNPENQAQYVPLPGQT